MNLFARLFTALLGWRHRHFVVAGNRFRARRLGLFTGLIEHPREVVLDVGYGYGQFEDDLVKLGVPNPVVGLDVVLRDASRHPNLKAFVVADAAHLPFAAGSIDLIYCNSLLEHVGDGPRQQQVFREIARVGRKFFVQTPNRHFPVEPHHLVPFFQYWPRPAQRWIGQRVLGYYEQVWLLDMCAVQALVGIAGGAVLWEEKVLGLTKSFVLSRRSSADE